MGRKLLPTVTPKYHPCSLHETPDEEEFRKAGLYMLVSIQFRGEQPRGKERWRYLYTAITRRAIDTTEPVTPREPARSLGISAPASVPAARCRDLDAASGYRHVPSAGWIAGGFVTRSGMGQPTLSANRWRAACQRATGYGPAAHVTSASAPGPGNQRQ